MSAYFSRSKVSLPSAHYPGIFALRPRCPVGNPTSQIPWSSASEKGLGSFAGSGSYSGQLLLPPKVLTMPMLCTASLSCFATSATPPTNTAPASNRAASAEPSIFFICTPSQSMFGQMTGTFPAMPAPMTGRHPQGDILMLTCRYWVWFWRSICGEST